MSAHNASTASSLPEGPRGRLLAMGLTLCLLILLWIGCAQPMIDWHLERAYDLERQQALLQRMAQLAAALPELQHQATREAAPRMALLEGASDAIAGAALQSVVQDMAGAAGASLTSIETLPAEQRSAYRRIGLRLSLVAPWPVLVELLRAAESGTPPVAGGPAISGLLIDDLQLRAPPLQLRGGGPLITASFTLLAFREAPDGKQDRK